MRTATLISLAMQAWCKAEFRRDRRKEEEEVEEEEERGGDEEEEEIYTKKRKERERTQHNRNGFEVV